MILFTIPFILVELSVVFDIIKYIKRKYKSSSCGEIESNRRFEFLEEVYFI